jgi:biopolymer transport protein ExbB
METFFQENVLKIWLDGGWLMIPLAILGLLTYGTIFEVLVYLTRYNFAKRNRNEWEHWIERPDDASGELGEVIQYSQYEVKSMADVRNRMDEIRHAHLPSVNRRLMFASILVSTAPLTGLLGTVTGMLATFAGLAVSSGGNTIDLVAGGISEALITTQTGLVLAIPGYVLINTAKRKRDELAVFFDQVEILTIQRLERTKKFLAAS